MADTAADVGVDRTATLQRPPLPSIPDFKSDTKNRYAGRDQLSNILYPSYSASDTGIMSMKESSYSTEEINDMIHNLHCQVETLKDKLHPGSTGKTSSVYENIDRSTVRNNTLPCPQRLVGSAHQSGLYTLRYLFDPQIGSCRRCAWFVILTGAVALLVFQLFDRTTLFLSQPTSVTIETKYYDRLAFPAVTVCNRNIFRLTKLVDIGLFDEVYNLYNGKTIPESLSFSTKALPMKGLNAEFLRNISHRKETFIRGCQWRDVPCGPRNFTETLTDYGLCYTFSPHLVHNSVHGSGPGDGLFLELNVEQYEYLLGGRSAVGARISVHESGRVPRMSEKGIDVSVGAHTSLEFDRTKNQRLSSTIRKCLPPSRQSTLYDREDCLAMCEAKLLANTCGCRSHPSDYADDYVSCERFQYIRCLLAGKDGTSARSNCSCPIQCQTVDFDASVSHAAMSTYAADSTVRRMADRDGLARTLAKSRDTYHRIDKAIFGYDVLRLSGTVDALKRVTLGISTYAEKTQNHESVYDSSMRQLRAALLKLNQTVSDDLPQFGTLTHTSFYPLIQQIRRRLDEILDLEPAATQLGDSQSAHARRTYENVLTTSQRIVGELNRRDSNTLQGEVRQGVEKFRWDMMNGIGKRYREFNQRRYEYNRTLMEISKGLDKVSVEIANLYGYIDTVTGSLSSRSTRDLGRAAKKIFELVKSLTKDLIPTLSTFLDKNIIRSYYNAKTEILKFARKLFEIMEQFTPSMESISESRMSLAPTLRNLQDNGRALSRKFNSLGQIYKRGEMKKSELAAVVNGEKIRSVVNKLKSALNHTQIMIGVLLESSNFLTTSLKPISHRLVDFGVTSPTQLSVILRSVQFSELRDEVYMLTRSTEKTMSDVSDYQLELADYRAGNRVNGKFYLQNFLQLEVYFRDLRETIVTQHRAYGLFDFTCDIGGTLALYMGISALTLFEFIDVVLSGLFCYRSRPYQASL